MKRSGPREARLHEFYKKILKDFFIELVEPRFARAATLHDKLF